MLCLESLQFALDTLVTYQGIPGSTNLFTDNLHNHSSLCTLYNILIHVYKIYYHVVDHLDIGSRPKESIHVSINIEPPTPQHTQVGGFKGSKVVVKSAHSTRSTSARSHIGKWCFQFSMIAANTTLEITARTLF